MAMGTQIKFDFGAIPDIDDIDMNAIEGLPELRGLQQGPPSAFAASAGAGTGVKTGPGITMTQFAEVEGSSEGLDFLTEGSHTPRQSIGSAGSKAGMSSQGDGAPWQPGGGLGASPIASNIVSNTLLQALNPAPMIPSNPSTTSSSEQQTMSVERAMLLNMSRTEAAMRTITLERDTIREEAARFQAALRLAMQEKVVLEEKVRSLEQLVKSMGQEAFSQALTYLRQAFDKAPIPRGIRFAPIDAELFEYLDQKLRGVVEDVGLDKLLVQRLRGAADADGLIPEVELLKFPRPWHLPGLDVSSDGKGLTGFYFVRPEWRPNERRRRREADMSPSDPKPPCWKESCQPTHFDDLARRYGGRPERRMFRFKLPGAREGPAGEKEKWKMYEYTLKSDVEMFEDRRMGLPVWVVCKVVREGPMTHEEENEQRSMELTDRGSGDGQGGAGGGNAGGGGDWGAYGSSTGGFGNVGGASSGGAAGPFGGGADPSSTYRGSVGGRVLSAAENEGGGNLSPGGPGKSSHADKADKRMVPASVATGAMCQTDSIMLHSQGVSQRCSSARSLPAISLLASTVDAPPAMTGTNPSTCTAPTPLQSRVEEWLKASPSLPASPRRDPLAKGLSHGASSSRAGAGAAAVPSPYWLSELPDASAAVGVILEDYLVRQLTRARVAHGSTASTALSLNPPSWARAPPATFWEAVRDDSSEAMPAEEDSQRDSEEDEEAFCEEAAALHLRPAPDSPVGMAGAEVALQAEAVVKACASLSSAISAFAEVGEMVRQLGALVNALLSYSGLDEAAALLWLMALRTALQGVRRVALAAERVGASRLLLAVQSPEVLAALQAKVRALGETVALIPRVFADSLSDRSSDALLFVRRDLQLCSFVPDAGDTEVREQLLSLVASVSSKKAVPSKADGDAKAASEKGGPVPLRTQLIGLGLESSRDLSRRLLHVPEQQRMAAVQVFQMLGGPLGPTAPVEEQQQLLHQERQLLLALRKGKLPEISREVEAVEPEPFGSDDSSGVASGMLVLLEAFQLSEKKADPPAPKQRVKGQPASVRATAPAPNEALQAAGVTPCSSSPASESLAPLVYSCPTFSRAELQAAVGPLAGQRLGELNALLGGNRVTLELLDAKAAPAAVLHHEVEVLAPLRHPHIVPLIGCCPEAACLVYEQLPALSLEDFFSSTQAQGGGVPTLEPLQWFVRMRIACEVASALQFLHSQPQPVQHRDLMPANIVLYREEVKPRATTPAPVMAASAPLSSAPGPKRTWWAVLSRTRGSPADRRASRTAQEGANPPPAQAAVSARLSSKLARVGLAALMPARQLGKTPVHDVVYLDPEFPRTDELVPASDVYAFGVVLLQLLTGKHATAALGAVTAFMEGQKQLGDVLDPTAGEWPLALAKEVAELAAACTDMKRALRPSMGKQVIPILENIRAAAAEAEGDICSMESLVAQQGDGETSVSKEDTLDSC